MQEENLTVITKKKSKRLGKLIFLTGILILCGILLLLRLSVVTDYFYHALVKDPERIIPAGNNIVSPADGIVIYIKKIENGVIPEIVKEGVAIPLEEMIKNDDLPDIMEQGYLIGIYMNTESVHITRAPIESVYEKQLIFNGPHMPMTEQEKAIILTQMIPGLTTFKKLLGMDPYSIEKHGDYILKSARETTVIKDIRGTYAYIIRIADYWVGNILTWVQEGQQLEKGQKLGMITWGSQVDFCFEYTEGLELNVKVGDYVYAGKTVLATYEK